jgi:hypothetical protein
MVVRMTSKIAVLAVALLATLLLLGCLGPAPQAQLSTGYSSQDVLYQNTSINVTGWLPSIELPSAMSKHVFQVNTTNTSTLTYTSNFSNNTTNCIGSTYTGGVVSASGTNSSNSTVMTGANTTRTLGGISVAERNTSLQNVTIRYDNTTGETVSVYLNGYLLGTLNQSNTETNFTNISGGYIVSGTNTFNLSNTNLTGLTNVTLVRLSYVSSSLNCTKVNASDGGYASLFETTTSGMLNFTVNASGRLNNTTTFNISVLGGDILVVNNTNSSSVGLYSAAAGVCVPVGDLAWNSTNWTNVSGLSTSSFVSADGNITICIVHPRAGDVRNYGAAIDSITVNGAYSYPVVGAISANVSMFGSIDCNNWIYQTNLSNINSTPQMTQWNNTLRCVRFNVTGITVNNSKDAMQLTYVGVS